MTACQRIGHKEGQADSPYELGKLLRDDVQMTEAAAAFSQALDIYTQQGNPAKVAISIEALGLIHEDQGQYTAAL